MVPSREGEELVVAIGLFALWIAGLVCALLCRGGALGGWFRLVPSLGEMEAQAQRRGRWGQM